MAEKAQVGDLIRIVNAEPYIYDTYKDGDILEVIGRFEVGDGVEVKETDLNGDTMFLFDSEYVIHRKAGEEEPKETFQERFPETYEYIMSGKFAEDLEKGAQGDGIAEMDEAYSESFDDVMPESDAVSHPSHYTQGRFETIEIIEEITQGYSDGYVSYCVGNALKYLARAPFKHESPLEDIAKARAYLDFAIKRFEATE